MVVSPKTCLMVTGKAELALRAAESAGAEDAEPVVQAVSDNTAAARTAADLAAALLPALRSRPVREEDGGRSLKTGAVMEILRSTKRT
jgi:hypothetical protein